MELTNYTPTALSSLKSRFEELRYDPAMLVKGMFETIESLTNGRAVLVDASNPTVMLLEFQAVHTANHIAETLVALRKQYPELAQSYEDLYHHMSDEDYINRFASPATVDGITFAISVQDIMREAVYDSSEAAYKLILPKDSYITVDETVFTLLYPIVIRRYQNGAVQVSFDTTYPDPTWSLSSTIIDYTVRQGPSLDPWLFFTVKLPQLQVISTNFTIDRTYNFEKDIVFSDEYYHARAFYRNSNTNGQWVEIKTTHTDQVFDPTVPTVSLKVLGDVLRVHVPIVYLSTGQISGELRLDVYTTKGDINLNLENYQQDNFVAALVSIDEERDQNVYTQAMGNVSFYLYSNAIVSGGKAGLSLEALRERVKYNAIGPQNLPITNVDIEATLENQGFDIVKNIDTLTNRVFLATRRLPQPTNEKLITPANIGMVTFVSNLGELREHSRVIDNGARLTVKSKSIWLSENSILSLLTQADVDAIRALGQTTMVGQINAKQYLYNPFYYVLDNTQEEFDLRAYALDQPLARDLNFVRQNQTLQLFVNIDTYHLKKVSTGYELRILTKSGNHYKNVEDSEVGCQLAFNPNGQTTYAYINGVLEGKNDDDERLYVFYLNTNHDIDRDDLICITNSNVEGITDYQAWIGLSTVFNVLHYTTSLTSSFVSDDTDYMLGKFILPAGVVGNSQEALTLDLGYALSQLWRRSRSFLQDEVYVRHDVDIPLLYTEDVMERDPVTGSFITIITDGNGDKHVQYNIIHHAGDPVLDAEGQPVFLHRVGDVVLDEHGEPVTVASSVTGREMDILVVDARYYFADDAATVAYRDEIEEVLTTWITKNIESLEEYALEQTRIFFYPKTTLGSIQVYVENGGTDYLTAEQSFLVTLHVKYAIYNDPEIREKLRALTVTVLDQYVGEQVINMTQAREELRLLYGDAVDALSITGLGGTRDYQLVKVASARNKLCLKKNLAIQADKSMIVLDAVEVEFKLSAI